MKRTAWLAAMFLSLLGCSASAPLRPGAAPLKKTGEVSQAPAGPTVELVALPSADERIDVPDFDGATAWLNVDHALRKRELAGRVVVVDFWTSCCINCLHTIPTLKKIEDAFRGQPVVVIGVHSPKFEGERGAERLRDIVHVNELEHPIAVDANMAIWDAWGVQGWPTIAVLDVEGRAVWADSGEPDAEDLTRVIASALAEGRAKGKLAAGELPGLRAEKEHAGALRYPGKVLALSDGGLAIADTGHDRVVLLDARGAVEAVVGSGLEGHVDGAFAEASFHDPQGMTEVGGALYVADTGNHQIRKIDRKARAVVTVAGTGELGRRSIGPEERPAASFALRSPWDLLNVGGTIYVALAGSHQIGAFDPSRGTIRLFAGNGREARVDGALLEASFAQPSALATDGKEIFVLDSETSSVRAIDPAKGQVRTVVGRDLFVFGDVDGDAMTARLQHPIGMTFAAGAIWVADSYNSKIKRINPRTGETRSVLGGADKRALDEPAGLGAAQGALFIADTNHHRVMRWPLDGKGALAPVALGDLRAPAPGVAIAASPARVRVNPSDPIASLGTLKIAPGAATRVRVRFQLPSGTGVNEEAPVRVTWTEATGLARVPDATRAKGAEARDGFDVVLAPAHAATSGELTGVLDMVVCDVATHAACLPVRRTLRASLRVEQGATPPEAVVVLPAAR